MEPEITPRAGPRVTDWSDFKISAEGLWWLARQEGIAYAQTGRGAVGGTNDFTGHDKEVEFSFQPGFRVGLGLDFRYDGWDIYANYTWLNPASHTGHASVTDSSGGMLARWLVSTPFAAAFPPFLTSAKARWKMAFDVLDTELGRNFFLSSKLSIRPFLGFKAAWIDQTNSVYYVLEPGAGIDTMHLKMRQDFTGFGIRMGVNSFWLAGEEWGIYGNFAFSELWSGFDQKRRDRSLPTGGSVFTSYHVHKDFHTIEPVLEVSLGLQYMRDFRGGRRRFTFQLGWEEQVWFAHNRFISPAGDMTGNLTFQGITGKLAFAW